MAEVQSAPRRENDALDDLFTYDTSMDDVFNTTTTTTNNGTSRDSVGQTGSFNQSAGGLGIDEEITVTKRRAPVAKLDETRLLSDKGISKLRQTAKKNLKFRGKGHEFSDVQKLLSLYQLWLDDLYPRAKFADGLAMLEKLGHTKRMQMMRKEWIDEGKPKVQATEQEDEEQQGDDMNPAASETAASEPTGNKQTAQPENPSRSTAGDSGAESGSEGRIGANGASSERPEPVEQPDDDELDALLAESANKDAGTTHHSSLFGNGAATSDAQQGRVQEDEFADEMDAMAEMDDMW
ncbi:Swi3-domain-containing protein [Rhizodiscina lignyota]|uniref:Chromosome segregation in meiosis protein n=1 Tax=Rhizodiscina lignyota TaxID=1504668 RepID=A0A9P4IDC7_9PEZI|nr:Swi3-domain-containing protein [Rhizodiscina lignyota]